MEVASSGTILGLILVLLPGATLRVTARRVRTQPDVSAFEESLYTILGGLLISALTIGIVGALRAIFPDAYPDPRRLLDAPSDYLTANYLLVYRTFAQYLVLSNAIAWIIGINTSRVTALSNQLPFSTRTATRQDIWSTYMIDAVPEGASVRAAIGTDFDLIITGRVAGFEVVEGLPHLVLAQPIYIQSVGSKTVPVDGRWPYLLVAGHTIRSLALSYVLDKSH